MLFIELENVTRAIMSDFTYKYIVSQFRVTADENSIRNFVSNIIHETRIPVFGQTKPGFVVTEKHPHLFAVHSLDEVIRSIILDDEKGDHLHIKPLNKEGTKFRLSFTKYCVRDISSSILWEEKEEHPNLYLSFS